MCQGKVVRNLLQPATEPVPEPGEEPARAGWLAYTPPVSGIFTAALVLDRVNWLSQDAASELQVGDLTGFDGGEIRGLRFGLIGTLNTFEKPWVDTIFGATNAFDKGFDSEKSDSMAFLDWRLDIPLLANSTLSIGKQKEPISGERVQSLLNNNMQERSAVADALLPSRNVGIVWNGNSPATYTSWAVGVFNDWFDTGVDLDESATQYIGRTTWAPLHSEDDSNLLHLGIGYRYSNGKEGFRSATESEINQAPAFVDASFGAAARSGSHRNLRVATSRAR